MIPIVQLNNDYMFHSLFCTALYLRNIAIPGI